MATEKVRLSINSGAQKKPSVTKYLSSDEGDVYRSSNDRSNWFTDATRGGLNFAGDVAQYIRSALGEKDTRGGFSTGDWMLGTGPKKNTRQEFDSGLERDRRASALNRGVRTNRGNSPFGGQDQGGLTDQFSKYLSQAESTVPGASDWGALESRLRGSAGESDAKLQAMYRALSGAIKADAPVIGGFYDEGSQAVDESAQQASQAIQQGYDSARQAQTEQAQALGIEQAVATLAADGGGLGFAAQDQGDAANVSAQNAQTTKDALTTNKASALNYNTAMGESAQLQGAEQRGSLQGSLQDALAEMAFSRSQESAQRQAKIYEIATALQQDAQAGVQPDPEMLQALAEFNAEQQQTTFQNTLNTKKVDSNVLLSLLKQTGGDMDKAVEIFGQMQASGAV